MLGDNLKLPVNDTLKASLKKIKPSLDTYISAGERIVGLALENPEAAQRNWRVQYRVQPAGRPDGGAQ